MMTHNIYGIQVKREKQTESFMNTVDLVIFACLNFREFLILRLFTKFRIREFSFFSSSSIFLNRFLNSRGCPPREIREN